MPGLIKIGRAENVKERMKSLSSASGVPGPFKYFYSRKVKDADAAEKKMHEALKKNRIEGTEFFELEPEPAKFMLQSPAVHSAISAKKTKSNSHKNQTSSKLKRVKSFAPKGAKASAFKFSDVGIRQGDKLSFVRDSKIVVTVVDEKSIEYRGTTYSLSGLARKILLEQYNQKRIGVDGPALWVYQGKTVRRLLS